MRVAELNNTTIKNLNTLPHSHMFTCCDHSLMPTALIGSGAFYVLPVAMIILFQPGQEKKKKQAVISSICKSRNKN